MINNYLAITFRTPLARSYWVHHQQNMGSPGNACCKMPIKCALWCAAKEQAGRLASSHVHQGINGHLLEQVSQQEGMDLAVMVCAVSYPLCEQPPHPLSPLELPHTDTEYSKSVFGPADQ